MAISLHGMRCVRLRLVLLWFMNKSCRAIYLSVFGFLVDCGALNCLVTAFFLFFFLFGGEGVGNGGGQWIVTMASQGRVL